jgi:hypothetical protein
MAPSHERQEVACRRVREQSTGHVASMSERGPRSTTPVMLESRPGWEPIDRPVVEVEFVDPDGDVGRVVSTIRRATSIDPKRLSHEAHRAASGLLAGGCPVRPRAGRPSHALPGSIGSLN